MSLPRRESKAGRGHRAGEDERPVGVDQSERAHQEVRRDEAGTEEHRDEEDEQDQEGHGVVDFGLVGFLGIAQVRKGLVDGRHSGRGEPLDARGGDLTRGGIPALDGGDHHLAGLGRNLGEV